MNWLSKFFAGETAPQSPTYDANALIIDVRTPEEFATIHVDGALNLPMQKFGGNYAKVAPDRARQIIVYCQSGLQSRQASQFLKLQRYVKVINVETADTDETKFRRKIV